MKDLDGHIMVDSVYAPLDEYPKGFITIGVLSLKVQNSYNIKRDNSEKIRES